MEKVDILKQILTPNGENSFCYPSKLREYFKSNTIPILMRRIFLESLRYSENEWFPLTKAKIKELDYLANSRVISDMKVLHKLGFVSTKVKGSPPVTYFKINYEVLENFLQQFV